MELNLKILSNVLHNVPSTTANSINSHLNLVPEKRTLCFCQIMKATYFNVGLFCPESTCEKLNTYKLKKITNVGCLVTPIPGLFERESMLQCILGFNFLSQVILSFVNTFSLK